MGKGRDGNGHARDFFILVQLVSRDNHSRKVLRNFVPRSKLVSREMVPQVLVIENLSKSPFEVIFPKFQTISLPGIGTFADP